MKIRYLIPLFFAVFACNSAQKSIANKETKAKLFTILYTSEYQGRETKASIVIKNQKDLVVLFKSFDNADIPTVDFSKSQVVALFLGRRSTGGYSISVERVAEEDGKMIVYKKEGKPSGGMVTTAFTSPFVIAEIYSNKEIIFK